MNIVHDNSQQQQQDIPAGIYFLVSKAPDFHTAVYNLQKGLNSKPYDKGHMLQILTSTEAVENQLQPGHYTVVHIVCAVIEMPAQVNENFVDAEDLLP